MGAISKKINFFEDDELGFDCEEEPQNQNIIGEEIFESKNSFQMRSQPSFGPTKVFNPISPIRNVGFNPENGGMSPVFCRHTNLVWVNKILKNY